MINREEAYILIKKYLKGEDNVRYSLAAEAILRELAKRLERDENLWGLTGLLHNLDYEYTAGEPEKRGVLSSQLLDGLLPEMGVNAIKANNYTQTDYIPTTSLDKSLIAVDATIGLIITITKSMPSKKLAEVDFKTLIEKFNDPNFAARYNRSRIVMCTHIGMELKVFLALSLKTLQNISDKIGL